MTVKSALFFFNILLARKRSVDRRHRKLRCDLFKMCNEPKEGKKISQTTSEDPFFLQQTVIILNLIQWPLLPNHMAVMTDSPHLVRFSKVKETEREKQRRRSAWIRRREGFHCQFLLAYAAALEREKVEGNCSLFTRSPHTSRARVIHSSFPHPSAPHARHVRRRLTLPFPFLG